MFDQAGRLPEPPLILFYGPRPNRNPEAPEQPDAHRLRCRVLAASRRAIKALCSPRRHLPSSSPATSLPTEREARVIAPSYNGGAPIVGFATLSPSVRTIHEVEEI